MRYLVTADEMKRYDANTINRLGVPGMVLMERAALAAREAVLDRLGMEAPGSAFDRPGMEAPGSAFDRPGMEAPGSAFDGSGTAVPGAAFGRRQAGAESANVLIMIGAGNNGGDGLALARLLDEFGIAVEIWCVADESRASEQWRLQRKILQAYRVKFSSAPTREEYTILVDALFGVGLSRGVDGVFREAVERFNRLEGFKLALDVPSGIDSDTGAVLGCAVKADETVTFGFCKRGLALYPGCEYAGRVLTAQIGIGERSFLGEPPAMFCYDSVADRLPPRNPSGNKGTFGKVLLVAGSAGMAGAAVLAARAAYRSGAGMVKVLTDEGNRTILQEAVPEALYGTYADLPESISWADTVVIGPGLGQSGEAKRCLVRVLTDSRCPLVIDADGLNLLAADEGIRGLLSERDKAGMPEVVLTPHVGELSRLTGKKVSELKQDLASHGTELSERFHVIVAAKDARTFVCCPGHPVYLNLSGNSGMATAGSGDVLAGGLGGLLAQAKKSGTDIFETVCMGVELHARAGDAAAADKGEHGCMAGDIAEAVAAVLRDACRGGIW